jgi:hypothetical protein
LHCCSMRLTPGLNGVLLHSIHQIAATTRTPGTWDPPAARCCRSLHVSTARDY